MNYEGRARRGACRLTAVVAAGVVIALASVGRADEIHLTNGAVLEGVPAQAGGEVLRLRMPAGELGIPRGVIARQVPGPTRWTRYQRERAAGALTAARHVELARWCARNRMPDQGSEHVRAALELDPTDADALHEAGYVRLGAVWMKAVSPPSAEQLDRLAGERQDHDRQIVEHLLRGWRSWIRAVRDAYLKNGGGRGKNRDGWEQGRERLLAVEDPLALPAACRVLGGPDQDPQLRLLLVELLGGSPTDVAALNLLALALLDDEESVRFAAADALLERKDPRVSRQLRFALECRNDRFVRRVARALGRMRDRSAVPDLIEALHVTALRDDAPRTTLRTWRRFSRRRRLRLPNRLPFRSTRGPR